VGRYFEGFSRPSPWKVELKQKSIKYPELENSEFQLGVDQKEWWRGGRLAADRWGLGLDST
jgi:hypothetical protein